MRNAQETLDQYFLEMRWRCLSLAADLDRIERSPGGAQLIATDPRLQKLQQAVALLFSARQNRAEQVEMLFSDKTPAPSR